MNVCLEEKYLIPCWTDKFIYSQRTKTAYDYFILIEKNRISTKNLEKSKNSYKL